MTRHHSEPACTDFQRECQAAIQAMLERKGISAEFETVVGEHETYVRSLISDRPERLELFIYDDEAGFFEKEAWIAFEASDFKTKDLLVRALSDRLEKAIADIGS